MRQKIDFVAAFIIGVILGWLIMSMLGCAMFALDSSVGLPHRQIVREITVFSQDGLNDSELAEIATHVEWCRDHGLTVKPNQIAVDVVEGTLIKPGVYSYRDAEAGQIGGRVVTMDPVEILVIRQSLACVRHELLHVHLKYSRGDPDPKHTDPLWRVWPLF